MSRFYASIEGQGKTEATRTGSKNSGIISHIRGWDSGIKVFGEPAEKDSNQDVFHIYLTSGSGNTNGDLYIGKAYKAPDGTLVFSTNQIKQ